MVLVTKPFNPGELMPREARVLTVEGREVDSTPREFDLLHYLMPNYGVALSRGRLLEQVWDYSFYGDARTVDVHIRRLVDALLTLSRFDSREFHPNLSAVNVADIVQEEVDIMEEDGSLDADRIHTDVFGGTGLVTDPDMLRQVVNNLLRNAAQYGGEVKVRAESDSTVFRVSLPIVHDKLGAEPLA